MWLSELKTFLLEDNILGFFFSLLVNNFVVKLCSLGRVMLLLHSILEFCFYSHLLVCKKTFALCIKWTNLKS